MQDLSQQYLEVQNMRQQEIYDKTELKILPHDSYTCLIHTLIGNIELKNF